jgi:N utilization substance protein A
VIVDVHKQPKGPQIVLSRTDPRLLVKLFEMEVPEIYDGTVVIKAAVRAPGERAKVAVFSRERDVDPVGACVGMKGSRVQAIIRELRGEKIDIIEYSDDLVTFAQSALAPAKITRVSVHHAGEQAHLDVIVEDEQLSLAIGKRGQNVRLASELIGSKIDIKSETDVKDEVADALARMLQSAFSSQERKSVSLTEPLDLTSVPGLGAKTAAELEQAGYTTLQALLDATVEDLQRLEGVGPKTAQAILNWAQDQAVHVDTGAEPAVAADEPVEEAPTASLQEDDFLAALSRAFKESEEKTRVAEQMVAAAEADAAGQAGAAVSAEAAEAADAGIADAGEPADPKRQA